MPGGPIIRQLPWAGEVAHDVATTGELSSDGLLLSRFVAGDEAAFASLMDRHKHLVASVCYRLLREAADADDAFQATFLVLARKARGLQRYDSVAGWLHQTARRTSLKLRSIKLRRQQLEQRAAREQSEVNHRERKPDAALAVHELAEILDAELARLSPTFREVLLLTQAEGLSRSEAAQRLGLSEAAVKDRLERARETLRARLVRRGITLSGAMLAAWLLPGTAQASSASFVATTAGAANLFAAGITTSTAAPAAITLAQGVLKMMGLEKLKYVALCMLSLITASGIAYGMLKDNPQRFEKGLVGQIVDVESRSQSTTVTIQLEEFQTLLNLDLSPKVKIWKAYEATTLTSLKPGQFASLRLGPDHRTVSEIHLRGTQHEVVINRISESGEITATLTDDDDTQAKPRPYQLAPDVILRIGGLPALREDLRPGMIVPLELADDGKTIHAIEAEAEADSIIQGSVLSIDTATRRVSIETEDEHDRLTTVSLAADATAIIEVDHERSDLAKIRAGSEVILRTNVDRNSIRAIRATTPPVDDDEAQP